MPIESLSPSTTVPAATGGLDPYPGEPSAYLNATERTGIAANGKPSYTIDQAGDQIVRSGPGWGTLGHAYTVTYAYRADAPATMPSDTAGFAQFNQAQIDQAELAIRAWEDVANIKFVRVGSGDTGAGAYSDKATILLGNYTSGEAGAAAFTYMPGQTGTAASSGDVWVNASLGYNAAPYVGNYGALTLVHELGHAIGLEHPSDYNASADQTLTYAADATYYEDDRQYTVMSYFSESNTGAYFGNVYPAAPMLDDIAAAQEEYGANMATRTGDTVYGFHSNAGEPWLMATSQSSKLVFAVWDAGGHDTFDFSGYSQSQKIDLHAGDFSNVGGLTGNVAIGEHVTIEAAIGGSGNDQIIGNDAGDSLTGGAGADTITAGAGSNVIRGDDGADSAVGGAGFDDINGMKGDDVVDGGSGGNDWLVGGQGNDLITAHASGNILYGNLGSDTLNGGTGNELIRGGQGDDVMTGGAGADWMSGDRGSDTLTGGTGADTFHAFSGAGLDVVTDFNSADGDRIQLDAGATFTVAQQGADVVINLGGTDEMVLKNVTLSSLPAGWVFTL
jgi:serralysin